jgi:cell division protein FtsW
MLAATATSAVDRVWCCSRFPPVLPAVDVGAERREDLDELPGFSIQPAEFSKILLLVFFAAVLVAKRSVFTSAVSTFLGMT